MLTPPRRRGPDPDPDRTASEPAQRPRRARISTVERLEPRDLPATLASPHAAAVPPPLPPPVLAPPVAPPAPGPGVAFVQFEPLTGRVLVTFTGDLDGYSTATLTDPANYSLRPVQVFSKLPAGPESRPRAGVVLAPEFRVTGVFLSTPVAPGMPQSVVVTVDNNQPLREGVYLFRIRSAGIVDLAGRPLDGSFTGNFPSGSSPGGADFEARLEEIRNTVLPALPVVGSTSQVEPAGTAPTPVFFPSVRRVNIRYAAAKPGRFMLAGGNNITLIPLGGQDFPGTYRAPSPRVNATRHAAHPGKPA